VVSDGRSKTVTASAYDLAGHRKRRHPDELLEERQRRLGLVFDAEMNIVPRR
jgi:hypothetical protein